MVVGEVDLAFLCHPPIMIKELKMIFEQKEVDLESRLAKAKVDLRNAGDTVQLCVAMYPDRLQQAVDYWLECVNRHYELKRECVGYLEGKLR